MKILYHRKNALTIKKVNQKGKKDFAIAAFNPNLDIFVVQIAVFNNSLDVSDEMHPSNRFQIAYLKIDKTPTEISNTYADFTDVFLSKLTIKLPKYININNHAIKLVDN